MKTHKNSQRLLIGSAAGMLTLAFAQFVYADYVEDDGFAIGDGCCDGYCQGNCYSSTLFGSCITNGCEYYEGLCLNEFPTNPNNVCSEILGDCVLDAYERMTYWGITACGS